MTRPTMTRPTMTRRDVLQVGAACCLTAATGCDSGTAARPEGGRVILGPVERLRRLVDLRPGRVMHLRSHGVYLARWDPSPGQESAYPDSAGGFVALTQRCPHLGCRLPFCESSGWFECPCHGSRFNSVGEYQFGPAPTGQRRFRLTVEPGASGVERLVLHTDSAVDGAPRGTATIDQEPAGPHCVG